MAGFNRAFFCWYNFEPMKTYSQKLQDPRWQKKRLHIMERDSFACQLCGDTETTLNVHHKEYTEKNIWDEKDENLVTICKYCHHMMHQDDSFIKNRFFLWDAIIYRNLHFSLYDTKVFDVIVSFSNVIEIWRQVDSSYDGLTTTRLTSLYKNSFESLKKSMQEVENG